MYCELVSVVIPVYNGEKYLRACIESILSQSYKNLEILFINDHSSDSTVEILELYRLQDSRINIINNQGRGLVDALNTGLKIAKGKYIARMDADDICLIHRIETQVKYLQENKDVFLICSNVRIISEKGKILRKRVYMPAHLYPPIEWLLLWETPIRHPTVMFRNSKEFFYSYSKAEDSLLWREMILSGKKIHQLDEVLVDYRIHSSNTTQIHFYELFSDALTHAKNYCQSYLKCIPPKFEQLVTYNLLLNKNKKEKDLIMISRQDFKIMLDKLLNEFEAKLNLSPKEKLNCIAYTLSIYFTYLIRNYRFKYAMYIVLLNIRNVIFLKILISKIFLKFT